MVGQLFQFTFGKAVVAECKRLGVIVDVTHIPEGAFYDVKDVAQQPIIVSHGALGKDIDDAKLKALAASGGLLVRPLYAMGLYFYKLYFYSHACPASRMIFMPPTYSLPFFTR